MQNTISLSALVGLSLSATALATTFYGPTPYSSFNDSPFHGQSFGSFYLEDFEDGALNTPGLSSGSGVVSGPSQFSDSVDADDGVIDGHGEGGHSFYSNNATNVMIFTFAAVNGAYPTSVGVVWTDVGNVLSGQLGYGSVFITAWGPGISNNLGSTTPVILGDGSALSSTADDRFFGVTDPGGIRRLDVYTQNSVDWEVDHVQYGYAPAPAGLALAGFAGLMLGRRRR